jgi:hypothetical protein
MHQHVQECGRDVAGARAGGQETGCYRRILPRRLLAHAASNVSTSWSVIWSTSQASLVFLVVRVFGPFALSKTCHVRSDHCSKHATHMHIILHSHASHYILMHPNTFTRIMLHSQAQRLPLGDKSSERKQEVGSRKQKADLGHRRGGDVARAFEVLGVGRTCCRAEIVRLAQSLGLCACWRMLENAEECFTNAVGCGPDAYEYECERLVQKTVMRMRRNVMVMLQHAARCSSARAANMQQHAATCMSMQQHALACISMQHHAATCIIMQHNAYKCINMLNPLSCGSNMQQNAATCSIMQQYAAECKSRRSDEAHLQAR